METGVWKYYNHAVVPTIAPHETPDLSMINNGDIWKKNFFKRGTPLLARWTEDFDCGYNSGYWYIVCDKPFDISKIKSEKRNKLKKRISNFTCKRIDPHFYAEQMADITIKDWNTYPKKYRPQRTRAQLIQDYMGWSFITHGAFNNEGKLCAFHGIKDCDSYFLMVQGKSDPDFQRDGVNDALIYAYVTDFSEEISNGKYITNGQMNLNHETKFNDKLCSDFGFRKAYCHICIKYNPKIKYLIPILYLLRKFLLKFDSLKLVHNINVVLKMEEIKRKQKWGN